MNVLQDRRVLLASGAGAALLAGVLIAVFATGHTHSGDENTTAPESKGELQVQLGEQAKLDPTRQLRCFVGGQSIGEATLADCAKKNGVAAQALDVGLDPSGALAAGGNAIQPLPSVAAPAQVAANDVPEPPVDRPVPAAAGAPVGECLRYGADGWRSAGNIPMSACVQTLFAGRCQQPGQALYGRWGGNTLRLVPGRVEMSGDNRAFHGLVDQGQDCSIPPL